MAAKEIRYDIKAREAVLQGINTLANAVKVTLGPRVETRSLRNPGALPLSPKMA
jgi:chaperonin GroEL